MMKKCFSSIVLFSILIFFFVPAGFAASPYADGEYSVPYTVLKADSDSASMANDYFLKPVKLLVQNGEMKIQMSVKNSSWIQSVQIGGVTPTVISEDPANDKRIMEFKVADLSQPLQSNMHIKIDDMNYDNHYTVRFAFDASNVTAATDSKTNETKGQTGSANQTDNSSTDQNKSKTVANPKTNDSTNVFMLAIILVMSTAFLVLKRRKTNV
ncbi:heme uptake protein IsdC [Robertmurraya massiliosenegalensis]|uniref:heme uptake protein IsdC n=1 Tax=Robertmurraya TaxID=2837507 RepID=UPI0039A6F30E